MSIVLPTAVLAEIRQELKEHTPWLAGLSLPVVYLGHVPADDEHLTEA